MIHHAKYTILLSVVGLLTACGAKQRFNAPLSQQDAGLIVSGSQTDIDKVLQQADEYRVLSAAHGTYEVVGLTKEEVKAVAPKATVDQNVYFDNMIDRRKNEHPVVAAMKAQAVESQEVPPILEGCDLSATAQPTPQIGLLNDVLNGLLTMNLGETVKLTGEPSQSHLEDGELELRWEVVAPSVSKLKMGILVQDTIDITPDSIGAYEIALVAKASDNSCNYQMGRFLVTHNPAIEFAEAGETMPSVDLSHFTFLEKTRALQARELATGKGVVIAVLDTGLHYNHPAIKFNLAVNVNEQGMSADVDNDGNGFAGDVLGWDFVNGDNLPFDDEGHGSHVAGLTSSHIFGTAPDSLVMPIKVLNAGGGGDVGSVIAGIYYATDNGARIINTSLQRLTMDIEALREAVQYAEDNGVIVISASGNDGLDLSLPQNEIFPGELNVTSLVNVAATGHDDLLTSYSNFGQQEVDVAAPGGDGVEPIYSLAPMNQHEMPFIGSGGTSMACPIVAGIAAQMVEANPNISNFDMKKILMTSGEVSEGLDSVVGSGRLLDAYSAVEAAASLQSNSPLM